MGYDEKVHFSYRASFDVPGMYIKMTTEFDEIFSVCRAFNSKYFGKKIFQKGFVFTEIDSKYFKQKKQKSKFLP